MDIEKTIKDCENALDALRDIRIRKNGDHIVLYELMASIPEDHNNYEPSKILDTLDFAIDASNGNNSYSVGFRNGLRYAKSLIDGKEPQFESNGYVNFITRKSPQEAYKEESEGDG